MEESKLPQGAVEIVVLQDCVINGPDHRSLGQLHAGDIVLTHESYLPHLRDNNQACLSSELGESDIDAAQLELDELERALAEAEAKAEADANATDQDEPDEPEDDSVDASITTAQPASAPRGRPKKGEK